MKPTEQIWIISASGWLINRCARPTTADNVQDDSRQEEAAHLPAASTHPLSIIQHPQLLPPPHTHTVHNYSPPHGARAPFRCFRCPKWATSPPFLACIPVVQGSRVPEQGKTFLVLSRATRRSPGRDDRHSVQPGAETRPSPPGHPCNHQGKFGKTVRAQQDRSLVYAFFVSSVTARGVTQAGGS